MLVKFEQNRMVQTTWNWQNNYKIDNQLYESFEIRLEI